MFRRDSSFMERQGPETLQDLMRWDFRYANILANSPKISQLKDNLGRGLLVATDFSGYDAPRECLRMMMSALASVLKVPLNAKVVRSCDWSKPQQQCLMLQSENMDDGGACVFQDLLDRLPEEYRDWIREAGPTKSMEITDAQQANENVELFLDQNRSALFSPCSKSYCCQHNQSCPVHVLPAFRTQVAGQNNVSPPRKAKKNVACPWWQKKLPLCEEMGVTNPKTEPIVFNVSGLVCTDYTPLGKKRGLLGAGLTEPMHAVWKTERQWLAENSLEDWFFTENSSRYPIEQKQIQALKSTHVVKHVTACPSELGYPMRRRRVFSFGYDHSRWVWTGPDSPEAVHSEFMEWFGCSTVLSGDVYVVATEQDVQSYMLERASRRRITLPPGLADGSMTMRDALTYLIPPGAMIRLGQYEKVRALREDLFGNFFADLDHNVDAGPSSGHFIPSLDTHPTIFAFKHNRLLIPAELLLAQGINMFADACGREVSPLAAVFQNFNEKDLRQMAGNSIHVPTFAAWMMYAMANVQRVPDMGPGSGVLTPLLEELMNDLEDAEIPQDQKCQDSTAAISNEDDAVAVSSLPEPEPPSKKRRTIKL